jgi:hypothetical protein
MKFLYPTFLIALLVLALPIIIHFFNFKRYKTVYFSNVGFLKHIQQETRKKSQLKHLLILLSRILALAALVLAFSRPYIPLSGRGKQSPRQTVAIYVDNSFSMKATASEGPLLETAKKKAVEIAESYGGGTRFLLLTNDFLPQHQYFLSKDQFIQEVTEIKESSQPVTFSQLYNRASLALKGQNKRTDKTLYYLSDFQKISFDPEKVKTDTSLWAYLIPFEAPETGNLFIDSCWFETPGRKLMQAEKLFVRVRNNSSQAFQNIPVKLLINDSVKAIANLTIEPNQKENIELNYTNTSPGIQLGQVTLNDYPVVYDNNWFLSYQTQSSTKVLGIYTPENNGSGFLKALFANDEYISYEESTANNIQVSQLKNYQCIFLLNLQEISSGLQNELKEFVLKGGTLAIFPAPHCNQESYNQLYGDLQANLISGFSADNIQLSEINYQDLLYKEAFSKQEEEADLPQISNRFSFHERPEVRETSLLKFRNGEIALARTPAGNGNVYSFAFPLDQSNLEFARHIIFVPTIYNLALNSSESQVYSRTIINPNIVNFDAGVLPSSGNLKLVNTQSKSAYILAPEMFGNGQARLNLTDEISEAGHYLIYDGQTPVVPLSYNYSRQESDLAAWHPNEITNLIKQKGLKKTECLDVQKDAFQETLKELNSGKQLWPWFIWLTILFVLCEFAIILFWKS